MCVFKRERERERQTERERVREREKERWGNNKLCTYKNKITKTITIEIGMKEISREIV